LGKHAHHVVLIHFPLALFIAGVVFDFLAQKTKKHGLLEAAYAWGGKRQPWRLLGSPGVLAGFSAA